MRQLSCIIMIFILLISLISGVCYSEVYNIKLGWDKNSEEDLAGYKLYRREEGTTDYSDIPVMDNIPADANTYEYTTPDTIVTNYFVLTAFDINNFESDPSNEVSFIPNLVSPDTPNDFTLKTILPLGSKIYECLFGWSKNNIEDDLAGFKLYRWEEGEVSRDNILDIPSDSNSCTYTTPETILTNYFLLSAYDNDGNESNMSNPVYFIPDIIIPENPTGLNIKSIIIIIN